MSPDVCLTCEHIERYLGEDESRVHALRGVSLQLEAGSIHAVVGPSGCGKSTLLYILGLLDHPDRGSVSIESELVSHLSDEALSRRRNEFIGFIFQFHFLMEDFSAQENVMIPMQKLGRLSLGEMKDRSAALLDAVGLGAKLQRPSRHLSGGEQQRVAIARALANDPRVILADEPTGNLDFRTGEMIFDLLTSLHRSHQLTSIFVTHNLSFARRCDRILRLEGGILVGKSPDDPASEPGQGVSLK